MEGKGDLKLMESNPGERPPETTFTPCKDRGTTMFMKAIEMFFALDRYKFTVLCLIGVIVLGIGAWHEPKLTVGVLIGALVSRIPGKTDLK